jgi:hypothetical protein
VKIKDAPVDPDDIANKDYVDEIGAGKVDSENGITGIWQGTQAQYDGLGTKDSTVLYIITQ